MAPGPGRTILLTGATGYIGGRLLERLESSGRDVRCMARRADLLRARVGPRTRVVAGDVLERGYVHQERRSERRQQRDLELERLFDGGASRKAEHPVVVDDCYLKVVSVADLDDRPRAAPKRFCDQPVAVGSHSPMVSDTTATGDDFRRPQRSEV